MTLLPDQNDKSADVLKLRYWVPLGLALLTLLVFGQVANHELINFDVSEYITTNEMVLKGVTWEGVRWAFTTVETGDWQPVTWLSWMLDMKLFGYNPRAFHLVNLAFHLANVLVLFWVLRRMTGDLWRPAIATALFAIHPLRAESVVWVAERKDVLSTFFLLGTCWFYLDYVKNVRRRLSFFLVHASFLLGLMAKPMLVTLPFGFLLLDYWPLGRTGSLKRFAALVKEKAGLMLASLGSCLITYHACASSGALATGPQSFFWGHLNHSFIALMQYLSKTFWPVDLAFFYPHPGVNLPIADILAGISVFIIISYIALKFRTRAPYLFLGWFWFVGTLIPVIGLVQTGAQGIADRYMYVPHLFFWVAVVWGGAFLLQSMPRGVRIGVPVLCLGILVILSWHQVGLWKTAISLNEHTLRVTKNNYVAHLNLSYAYMLSGDFEKGIHHADEAFRLSPESTRALNHIAFYMMQNGKSDAAQALLENAVKVQPRKIHLWKNLALVYLAQKKYDAALQAFQTVLTVEPASKHVRKSIIKILVSLNREDEAIEQMNIMLSRNPAKKSLVPFTMGQIYMALNNDEKAMVSFQEALTIDPNDAMIHFEMGNAAVRTGDIPLALKHFEIAAAQSPDNSKVRLTLGSLYMDLNEYGKAERQFRKAARLGPDMSAELDARWGILKLKQGQWDEAVLKLEKALKKNPHSSYLHQALGDALLGLNRQEEAVRHYGKAREGMSLPPDDSGALTVPFSVYPASTRKSL